MSIARRIEALENPKAAGAGLGGLAEDIKAVRKRRDPDPVAAEREAAERRRAFLSECDVTLAAGRRLDPLAERIMHAYRRSEACEATR